MKQVFLTLGLLLAVMVGFYWVSNRFEVKKEVSVQIADKEIYFETPEKLMAMTETEIKLLARHENGKLVSYWIDFNYDPAKIKILNIEVNKDVFDKIGFWDEKYFLYFEDADFSMRARKAKIPIEFLGHQKSHNDFLNKILCHI